MFGYMYVAKKITKYVTKSLWSGIAKDLQEIREAKDSILNLKATGEAALEDGKLTPDEMRDILTETGHAVQQVMEAVEVIERRIAIFK